MKDAMQSDTPSTLFISDGARENPRAVPGLIQNWNFISAPVPRWRRRQAVELFLAKSHRLPKWSSLRPLKPKSNWTVYFIYAPDGVLSAAHRFTLSRLKDLGISLLVICATTAASRIPEEVYAFADALFWKDLPGYDFSAYTLALQQISKHSSGADVFLMNDSILGPFSDLKTCLTQSSWDLTGFTASSQLAHHIQSYAFSLKSVDRIKMLKLAPVFFPFVAISDLNAVIALQELRLARVASRTMSVGAFWYGDVEDVIDPTLSRPFELINTGFPFIKRSLLGKHQKFVELEKVKNLLHSLGHPD